MAGAARVGLHDEGYHDGYDRIFGKRGEGKVSLDLFGGRDSQNQGAINVDKVAQSGVRADATRLPFETAAADAVIASNPYVPGGGGIMDWLPEAARALKLGGRLYVNATQGNKFGRLPDAAALDSLGLRVVREAAPLESRFWGQVFRRTDGSVLPDGSVRTTILEKVK